MKKFRLAACLLSAMIGCCGMAFADSEWDIRVFRPNVNPRDHKNDVMVRAGDKYTAETGGKITYILGDWDGVESRLLSDMASGNPIDVVYVNSKDFPKFSTRGYVQALGNAVNISRLSVSGTQIFNYAAAQKVFQYNNQYYAACETNASHFYLLMYNKTMMDNAGIPVSEQPEALYARGEWDWAHMAELAKKLSSGTGANRVYGLGCSSPRIFAYMNGGEYMVKDSSGAYSLNLDDPKIVESLEFLRTGSTEGWFTQDAGILAEGFSTNKLAMIIGMDYESISLCRSSTSEIAYVRLPKGPSVSECPAIFECEGYAIGKGSTKQTAAGKYIEYCLKEWYSESQKNRATWPREVKNMYSDLLADAVYPGVSSSAIDPLLSDIINEVTVKGKPALEVIEKFRVRANAQVSQLTAPIGTITKLPFTAFTVNFDNYTQADLDSSLNKWATTSSARFTIVSGPQAIGGSGKSIKVEFNPAVDGSTANLILTNPNKIGIVGWRNYQVEFDVKLSGGVVQGTPSVYLSAYANDLFQYGYVTRTIPDGTTFYHVSGTISNVNQNGKIGFVIGLENCSSIIIDNIKVTEK